jgi:hypothetical protein
VCKSYSCPLIPQLLPQALKCCLFSQLQYRSDRATPDLILRGGVLVSARCSHWPSVHCVSARRPSELKSKLKVSKLTPRRTYPYGPTIGFYMAKNNVWYSTSCLMMMMNCKSLSIYLQDFKFSDEAALPAYFYFYFCSRIGP